jgi:NAD(P)-dependent dehydrogenase (short-subunit alcohol dehydrogenase family)
MADVALITGAAGDIGAATARRLGTDGAHLILADVDREPLESLAAELAEAGVEAIFLGYFFEWDPTRTAEVASAHGFKDRSEGAKTGYYSFADIDDDFISIHHYVKWFKFGFTRTYDNLSLEIRNGRITRDEAIEILRERGDETPREDIDSLTRWLGITEQRFFEIAEGFRNQDVWTRRDGTWVIDDFLIDDWRWS